MLPFGTEAEARAQPQAGDLVEHHLGAQARAADIGHVRRGETIAAAIDAQLLRGLCIEDRHAPADLGVKTAERFLLAAAEDHRGAGETRSEERRGGNGCVTPCSSWGAPYH